MPGGKMLLLALASSISISILLFTINNIEATIKDSPIEQIQCDPAEDDTCDEMQTASNDSAFATKQAGVEGQNEVQVNEQSATTESGQQPSKKTHVWVTFDRTTWFNNLDLKDPKPELYAKENEIEMVAYVQGKKVDILNKHVAKVHEPITDARDTLGVPPPERKVEFVYDKLVPISIIVVGYEVDGCPRVPFPDDLQERVNKELKLDILGGQLNGGTIYDNILHPSLHPHLDTLVKELKRSINSQCAEGQDEHEILTSVNRVFYPPNYEGKAELAPATITKHVQGEPHYFNVDYVIDIFINVFEK